MNRQLKYALLFFVVAPLAAAPIAMLLRTVDAFVWSTPSTTTYHTTLLYLSGIIMGRWTAK